MVSFAQKYRQEGWQEGWLEGWREGWQESWRESLQEGWRESLQDGRQEWKSDALTHLLEKRVGILPEAARAQIVAASAEQLDAWLDATLTAESLPEMLGAQLGERALRTL